jgi:hypothetical protein
MQRNVLRFGILAAALLNVLIACTHAGAQPQKPSDAAPQRPAETATPDKASGLTLTCEVYCSPTKLRTANARIRWQVAPSSDLAAAGADNLARAEQRLEATVFKNGFEKDLFISLPVVQPNSDQLAAPRVSSRQRGLRAFQIRLADVARPQSMDRLAAGTDEVVAEIENLEPGMKYTWRVAIDTAARDFVSQTVTCQAPVCPADMVREDQP